MADKFDPYGDFDHIVAIPLDEAILKVKLYLQERSVAEKATHEEIRNGTSSVEKRKLQMEEWLIKKEEAELLLFRSIDQHNETSIRCGFVREDSSYHPVYEVTDRCEPSSVVYLQSPTKRYKYNLEVGK
jgi:hypothetical protein